MDPKVAIVILNWNGWRDTIECLESLRRTEYSSYWIVLVDNGSQDDSLAKIREYCSGQLRVESRFFQWDSANKPITILDYTRKEALAGGGKESLMSGLDANRRLILIRNEKNYGFAEGNNIGIRYALKAFDPDYIMLLNNDTVVDPHFLAELMTVAGSDDKIGILGPKMYYYDFKGRSDVILYAGAKIKPWREVVYKHIGAGELDAGQFSSNADTEWCSGAAMMIRRSLLENALLNTNYAFGNEDAEYCMNATKSGIKVVYVYKSKVWHKVGVSRVKTGQKIRREFSAYSRFISENFSRPVYFYHLFIFFVSVLPRWVLIDVVACRDKEAMRALATEMRKLLA